MKVPRRSALNNSASYAFRLRRIKVFDSNFFCDFISLSSTRITYLFTISPISFAIVNELDTICVVVY